MRLNFQSANEENKEGILEKNVVFGEAICPEGKTEDRILFQVIVADGAY